MGTVFINGMPMHTPNTISKENKEFHVSYNNRDVSHYGSNTTALYINETSQFLVLNGDHRKEYNVLNTLSECVAYFYANIDKANTKSEHGKVFKISKEGKGLYINGGY